MTARARVLVIVPFPLDDRGLARQRTQLDEVRGELPIDFVYKPVRITPGKYDSLPDYLVANLAVYEAGIDAEADGFDAVCVDTMSDSGVDALRARLDIPVIGPARASFHTALMLGDKFSIIWYGDPDADRLSQYGVDLYLKLVRDYGLTQHCASVRLVNVKQGDKMEFEGREEEVLPRMLDGCLKCIEDGADVICLGSTTMHEAHAYLAERLPVPIINPGPLSYKLVEAALALGLRQSRAAYMKPRAQTDALVHAMLEAGAG